MTTCSSKLDFCNIRRRKNKNKNLVGTIKRDDSKIIDIDLNQESCDEPIDVINYDEVPNSPPEVCLNIYDLINLHSESSEKENIESLLGNNYVEDCNGVNPFESSHSSFRVTDTSSTPLSNHNLPHSNNIQKYENEDDVLPYGFTAVEKFPSPKEKIKVPKRTDDLFELECVLKKSLVVSCEKLDLDEFCKRNHFIKRDTETIVLTKTPVESKGSSDSVSNTRPNSNSCVEVSAKSQVRPPPTIATVKVVPESNKNNSSSLIKNSSSGTLEQTVIGNTRFVEGSLNSVMYGDNYKKVTPTSARSNDKRDEQITWVNNPPKVVATSSASFSLNRKAPFVISCSQSKRLTQTSSSAKSVTDTAVINPSSSLVSNSNITTEMVQPYNPYGITLSEKDVFPNASIVHSVPDLVSPFSASSENSPTKLSDVSSIQTKMLSEDQTTLISKNVIPSANDISSFSLSQSVPSPELDEDSDTKSSDECGTIGMKSFDIIKEMESVMLSAKPTKIIRPPVMPIKLSKPRGYANMIKTDVSSYNNPAQSSQSNSSKNQNSSLENDYDFACSRYNAELDFLLFGSSSNDLDFCEESVIIVSEDNQPEPIVAISSPEIKLKNADKNTALIPKGPKKSSVISKMKCETSVKRTSSISTKKGSIAIVSKKDSIRAAKGGLQSASVYDSTNSDESDTDSSDESDADSSDKSDAAVESGPKKQISLNYRKHSSVQLQAKKNIATGLVEERGTATPSSKKRDSRFTSPKNRSISNIIDASQKTAKISATSVYVKKDDQTSSLKKSGTMTSKKTRNNKASPCSNTLESDSAKKLGFEKLKKKSKSLNTKKTDSICQEKCDVKMGPLVESKGAHEDDPANAEKGGAPIAVKSDVLNNVQMEKSNLANWDVASANKSRSTSVGKTCETLSENCDVVAAMSCVSISAGGDNVTSAYEDDETNTLLRDVMDSGGQTAIEVNDVDRTQSSESAASGESDLSVSASSSSGAEDINSLNSEVNESSDDGAYITKSMKKKRKKNLNSFKKNDTLRVSELSGNEANPNKSLHISQPSPSSHTSSSYGSRVVSSTDTSREMCQLSPKKITLKISRTVKDNETSFSIMGKRSTARLGLERSASSSSEEQTQTLASGNDTPESSPESTSETPSDMENVRKDGQLADGLIFKSGSESVASESSRESCKAFDTVSNLLDNSLHSDFDFRSDNSQLGESETICKKNVAEVTDSPSQKKQLNSHMHRLNTASKKSILSPLPVGKKFNFHTLLKQKCKRRVKKFNRSVFHNSQRSLSTMSVVEKENEQEAHEKAIDSKICTVETGNMKQSSNQSVIESVDKVSSSENSQKGDLSDVQTDTANLVSSETNVQKESHSSISHSNNEVAVSEQKLDLSGKKTDLSETGDPSVTSSNGVGEGGTDSHKDTKLISEQKGTIDEIKENHSSGKKVGFSESKVDKGASQCGSFNKRIRPSHDDNEAYIVLEESFGFSDSYSESESDPAFGRDSCSNDSFPRGLTNIEIESTNLVSPKKEPEEQEIEQGEGGESQEKEDGEKQEVKQGHELESEKERLETEKVVEMHKVEGKAETTKEGNVETTKEGNVEKEGKVETGKEIRLTKVKEEKLEREEEEEKLEKEEENQNAKKDEKKQHVKVEGEKRELRRKEEKQKKPGETSQECQLSSKLMERSEDHVIGGKVPTVVISVSDELKCKPFMRNTERKRKKKVKEASSTSDQVKPAHKSLKGSEGDKSSEVPTRTPRRKAVKRAYSPSESSSFSASPTVRPPTEVTPSSVRKARNYCAESVVKPFTLGWMREVVHRATGKGVDIYYFTPEGSKLRSMPEVTKYLNDHKKSGLTIQNFTFSKETVYREPFEKERGARVRTAEGVEISPVPVSSSKPSPLPLSSAKTPVQVLPKKVATAGTTKKLIKPKQPEANGESTPKRIKVQTTTSSEVKDGKPATDVPGSKAFSRSARKSFKGSGAKFAFREPTECSPDQSTSTATTTVTVNPVTAKDVTETGKDVTAKDVAATVKDATADTVHKDAEQDVQLLQVSSTSTEKRARKVPQRFAEEKETPVKKARIKYTESKKAASRIPRPCTNHCSAASFQEPSVQCGVCLCMFHRQCVPQVSKSSTFVCKPCMLSCAEKDGDCTKAAVIPSPDCSYAEDISLPSLLPEVSLLMAEFPLKGQKADTPYFLPIPPPPPLQKAPENSILSSDSAKASCSNFPKSVLLNAKLLESSNNTEIMSPSSATKSPVSSSTCTQTLLPSNNASAGVCDVGQPNVFSPATGNLGTTNLPILLPLSFPNPLNIAPTPVLFSNIAPMALNSSLSPVATSMPMNLTIGPVGSPANMNPCPSPLSGTRYPVILNNKPPLSNSRTFRLFVPPHSCIPVSDILRPLSSSGGRLPFTKRKPLFAIVKGGAEHRLMQSESALPSTSGGSLVAPSVRNNPLSANPLNSSEASKTSKPESTNQTTTSSATSGVQSGKRHSASMSAKVIYSSDSSDSDSGSMSLSEPMECCSNSTDSESQAEGSQTTSKQNGEKTSEEKAEKHFKFKTKTKSRRSKKSSTSSDSSSVYSSSPGSSQKNAITTSSKAINCCIAPPYTSLLPHPDLNTFTTGYDCLNMIFKNLKVCDLLRAAQVCKSWNSLASQRFLWDKVSLQGVNVLDWMRCSESLKKYGTKALNLRGIHLGEKKEFWRDFVKSLSNLSGVEHITFGQVPPFVLESVADTMPLLQCLECYCLTTTHKRPELWTTTCKLKFFNLRFLRKLRKLKIRSAGGLLTESEPIEIKHLLELQHLSLTSLKEFPGSYFRFVSHLPNLISLELGDCSSWNKENYEVLSKLANLRQLRLENGGGFDIGLADSLRKMTKLEEFELMKFKVPGDLGSALETLEQLTKLSLWPDNSQDKAARINYNAFQAASKAKHVIYFCWGIISPDDCIPLLPMLKEQSDDSQNYEDEFDEIHYEDFFERLCIAMPDAKVEMKCISEDFLNEYCSIQR